MLPGRVGNRQRGNTFHGSPYQTHDGVKVAIDTRERTVHAQQVDTDTLAEQWPGWYLWRSTTDHGMPNGWCATHEGPLTPEQERVGMSRTLVENDPEALVAELHRQAEIEAKL